jgi:RNA-directed DNA polymerase
MNSKQNEAQPSAQAGKSREADRVAGEVGVARSSVDLWDSITHGEPRGGTCSNAMKRSEGSGDGPQGLTTPKVNKVRKLQITLYRKAKAEPQYRFWSLYGEVLRKDVLAAALAAVVENGGAPGVDGESLATITATSESREQWLEALRGELQAKTYRPSPVRRVWIAKRSGGGERPLGIPTVKDRVVQSAVYLVLMPIYEADFHEQSYGFRPKRRAHQAMEAIREGVRTGRVEVLDADLSKFFDNIPHRALIEEVARRVSDGAILALIKAWLRAPIVEEGREGKRRVTPNRQGTPQGGVISPLLANIYLNPLDHQINGSNKQRHRMVRYADDFVVLSPAGQSAPVREEIESWLEGRGLKLNAAKTRTVKVTQEAIRFLGFSVKVRRSRNGRSYPHVEASGESCRELRQKVSRILNHRTQWRPIAEAVEDVNQVVRGWSGYFHYGNSAGVFARVTWWLRNRLRRWLWRKHGCRGGLHKHYANEQLETRYGLWSLPRSAAWTTA